MKYDCIIVGGGPAGIISALQLKRSGFDVLLIEKEELGGLLRNAKKVENYLGFIEGASGEEMVKVFKKQLENFDVEVVKGEVLSVSKNEGFAVKIDGGGGGEYFARSVIVATGTVPKTLGVPGEEELAGDKLFYHMKDFPDCTGKKILIIGGGDVGFDYAVNLFDKGNYPKIITKGEIKCLSLLEEEARERGLQFLEGISVHEIKRDGEQVKVLCEDKSFLVDFVLVAIGRKAAGPDLQGAEGLFFAGDVHGNIYRQVHIATGDALLTAMKVVEYINAC